MATIKEISKEVGVSPSTVSIVLSGKAHERKISEKTRLEVINAAHRLGYRVNIAARRLRVNHDSGIMISVFMAMDQRAYMMTRFMLGLYNATSMFTNQIEIVAHYYNSGFLHTMAEKIALTNCAIICNADDEDQKFLESVDFAIPIVLYYRSSEKYFSVNTNQDGGKIAAEVFARRGHKHAVLLDTNTYFAGMKRATTQFIETARAHSMFVTSVNETHSMQGGYKGGLSICKMNPLPDCILSMADTMSIGLLRAFGQTGIKIPEQIELISMGTENPEMQEYASTAISSIYFPIEELTKECIRLLFLQLYGKVDKPFTVELPSVYVQRETCGI